MLRLFLFTAVAFGLANTSLADHRITAINGHTTGLDGNIMIVQDVICPSIDTPEVMDAKHLAKTYAHGRNITCKITSIFSSTLTNEVVLEQLNLLKSRISEINNIGQKISKLFPTNKVQASTKLSIDIVSMRNI